MWQASPAGLRGVAVQESRERERRAGQACISAAACRGAWVVRRCKQRRLPPRPLAADSPGGKYLVTGPLTTLSSLSGPLVARMLSFCSNCTMRPQKRRKVRGRRTCGDSKAAQSGIGTTQRQHELRSPDVLMPTAQPAGCERMECRRRDLCI